MDDVTRDLAIEVQNLSKRYQLGALPSLNRTFGESLASLAANALHRVRGRHADSRQTFWALKDVSFDVPRGQVLGIIGRNGAGKSTLLKILSQITDPTEGRAAIHGRVGSLLEVGTGFHPELTGRENIFLNGAILGMRKAEIQANFDRIVEFAEITRFLDTPVKRYSSGMYVRLAFAVAAHLKPEILIVDEVLAVGDSAFQQKCLAKMSDVASEGRTVLFVSHQLAAVRQLCHKVVWLADGQVKQRGDTATVIDHYLGETIQTAKAVALADNQQREGNGRVRLTGFHVEDEHGQPIETIRTGQRCRFYFRFRTTGNQSVQRVSFAFGLRDRFDKRVTRLSCDDQSIMFDALPPEGDFCCEIQRMPLAAGEYTIGAIVEAGGEMADLVQAAATVRIEPGDFYERGRLNTNGPIFIPHAWSLRDAA
jgi:lipopolysaccharide transport system ATP-binding protein